MSLLDIFSVEITPIFLFDSSIESLGCYHAGIG